MAKGNVLFEVYINNSFMRALLTNFNGGNMIPGIITKGIGGFYYVDTGEKLYECRARGLFRLKKCKTDSWRLCRN